MFFMPFNILGMWFRGCSPSRSSPGGFTCSVGGTTTLTSSSTPRARCDGQGRQRIPSGEERRPASTTVTVPGRRIFRFDPGWNRPTLELSAALALLVWATWAVGRERPLDAHAQVGHKSALLARCGPNEGGQRETGEQEKPEGRRPGVRSRARCTIAPEADEDPFGGADGEVHTIRRPDGSELRVECYGPPDAPPIVWTHGWGANSTEWFYQKRYLADRFRLIVWDEPGLGLSKKPDNNDYRLENLAADLEAVLAFAGGRPAVLVGHSIGGMITLTFCKEFPERLGTRVAGLVLVHTTYTNPVRTTQMAGLYTAIEKPVLIPLMYLTIALWPLVWLMNWMSYFNGSAHRSTHKSSFSGNETRGQLDFAARFMPHGRPDVLARGMLGMIAYDATEVLPGIKVPTLVVVGDKDTTTTPEAGEFIVSRSPMPGSSRSPLPSTWG